MTRAVAGVSDEVMAILMSYGFPGNVRELENIIEHAFVMCRDDVIQPQHLPSELRQLTLSALPPSLHSPLQDLERQAIVDALRLTHGNRLQAAKSLQLHRTSLWRKMKKYGLR
jgi:transcriptional regulator with PAS, ATPase and Fis domain